MLHHIYVPLKIVKKHALDLIIIGFNHLKSVNESWELKESQYTYPTTALLTWLWVHQSLGYDSS